MIYNTSENYDLGQLRAKLVARQEYSVNHLSYRYYEVKSQSLGKEKMMSLLSRK